VRGVGYCKGLNEILLEASVGGGFYFYYIPYPLFNFFARASVKQDNPHPRAHGIVR